MRHVDAHALISHQTRQAITECQHTCFLLFKHCNHSLGSFPNCIERDKLLVKWLNKAVYKKRCVQLSNRTLRSNGQW